MEKAPFSRGSKFVDKGIRRCGNMPGGLRCRIFRETIVQSATATPSVTRCGGSMMRKEGSGSGGVSADAEAAQKLAMTSSFGSPSNSNSSLQMPRVLRRPPSGDVCCSAVVAACLESSWSTKVYNISFLSSFAKYSQHLVSQSRYESDHG